MAAGKWYQMDSTGAHWPAHLLEQRDGSAEQFGTGAAWDVTGRLAGRETSRPLFARPLEINESLICLGAPLPSSAARASRGPSGRSCLVGKSAAGRQIGGIHLARRSRDLATTKVAAGRRKLRRATAAEQVAPLGASHNILMDLLPGAPR